MVLAKELKRLIDRRIAFMNESVQALLSCRHSRYGTPFRRIPQNPDNRLYKPVRVDINLLHRRGSRGIQA